MDKEKLDLGISLEELQAMLNYVAGKAGIKNGDIILGYYDGETYIPLDSWKQLFDYGKILLPLYVTYYCK